jgi:hypothetical protein
MKKTIFFLVFILGSLCISGQQYFSNGFRSDGDGIFTDGTKIQIGDFYLIYSADSAWIEKPLSTWYAPLSEPVIVSPGGSVDGDVQLYSSGTFGSSNDLIAGSDFNWTGQVLNVAESGGSNFLNVDLNPGTSNPAFDLEFFSTGMSSGFALVASPNFYGYTNIIGNHSVIFTDTPSPSFTINISGDDIFQVIASGIIVQQLSGSLTDGTPTDAEIDAVIGDTPAGVGAGFQVTIKDSDGTGSLYKVESDGTNWFYIEMTQAV